MSHPAYITPMPPTDSPVGGRAASPAVRGERCRVLVLERDPSFAGALRYNLELDGHSVEVVRDLVRIRVRPAEGEPHLVIAALETLDDAGPNGLLELRRDEHAAPVLVIASRHLQADELPGFVLGRDEYVVRPVSVGELHARIESMLRRAARAGASAEPLPIERPFTFGRVQVDPAARLVARAGEEISLRPKEFDLLLALARRGGKVATRAELLRDVWGYSEGVYSRTVDAHILQLRRKLEDNPTRPRHILTSLKSGYRLVS